MSGSTFRPRRRDTPEINVASLVDVVLLLLLFFMLSTTFNKSTELQIQLPEATSTATNDPAASTSINIKLDQYGHCFIGQQSIPNPSVDILEPLLRQASLNRADIPVQIEADARTPHQAVITVMDAARRAGLLQIAFPAIQDLHSPAL